MQTARAPAIPFRFDGLVRRAGLSLLLNAACPWAAYQILTAQGFDTVTALAMTAVFPIAGILIGWRRSGHPDVLGIISVLFIALSVAVALATDNQLAILLRRSLSNAVFAGLCFGSLLLGRPMMFYVAREFVAGWDRAASAGFDAQWQQPGFRQTMRRITVAWGCWFVVQAVGRVVTVELLPVPTFLAAWSIVSILGTFAMISWSMAYARRGEDRHVWDPVEHGALLDEQSRLALDRAGEEAKRLRHRYIGTEHLLFSLAAEVGGQAAFLLQQMGVDLDGLRERLLGFRDLPPEPPPT